MLGPDGFNGFNGFRSGADGQLRAQPVGQTGLAIDPMVGGVGVGDTLIPADLRNPGCGGIEGGCVAANAASWPVISSLMQIVRVSVLFIRIV